MITVGNKSFKTKKELLDKCKDILNNTKIDNYLVGDNLFLIDDILKMHHQYKTKVGSGDYSIGVRRCQVNFKNKQFFIEREDGSDTDFSCNKIIQSPSKATVIKDALREAVKLQTIAYKEKYFKDNQDRLGYVICEETGLKIKKKDSHLDHYPKQFNEIIKEWVEVNNLCSDMMDVEGGGDNSSVYELVDKNLQDSFKEYHKSVATYRVVLDKVNLQRGRSEQFKF